MFAARPNDHYSIIWISLFVLPILFTNFTCCPICPIRSCVAVKRDVCDTSELVLDGVAQLRITEMPFLYSRQVYGGIVLGVEVLAFRMDASEETTS